MARAHYKTDPILMPIPMIFPSSPQISSKTSATHLPAALVAMVCRGDSQDVFPPDDIKHPVEESLRHVLHRNIKQTDRIYVQSDGGLLMTRPVALSFPAAAPDGSKACLPHPLNLPSQISSRTSSSHQSQDGHRTVFGDDLVYVGLLSSSPSRSRL